MPSLCGLDKIDTESGGCRRQVCARVLNCAPIYRLPPQPNVLHDILGFCRASEHTVRNAEQTGTHSSEDRQAVILSVDLRAGADGRRCGRVTCCHECTYLSVQRNVDRRFANGNERVFRSLAFPLVVNPPSPDHRAFSTVLRAQFPVTKRWDVRSYQVRRTVMNCLGRNSNGTIEMGEPEQ